MKLKNKLQSQTHLIQLGAAGLPALTVRWQSNVEAAAARNFGAVREAYRATALAGKR